MRPQCFPRRIKGSQASGIHRTDVLLILTLSVALFAVAFYARNKYSNSDPLGCLLTSQAIIEQGTIRLDAYEDTLVEHRNLYGGRIIRRHDHWYYYFPLGTCLYSTPFVWVANSAGMDMSHVVSNAPVDDFALQNVIAALSVAVCTALIYGVCRCFFAPAYSAGFSLAFSLGSPIMSTMGTALWSLNFEVLFLLLSTLLLVRDQQQKGNLNTYLLGFFMFSAYLCRPTSAIFITLVLLYVLSDKAFGEFVKLAATLLLLFAAFVTFSRLEYQQTLPPYYAPQRIAQSDHFVIALYGNLLSPARGLLVYCPYLLVTIVGIFLGYRSLTRSWLFWLASAWFVLHLIAISRFPHWWGGHSYGPRLLTDVMPAWILLTLLVWEHTGLTASITLRRATSAIFLGLSLISIAMHTYQGLYNPVTGLWNTSPNIDSYPEYLFDWKYPQFMATPERLQERLELHQERYE